MRNTKKAISILLTLLMVVGMMSTFAFAGSTTDADKGKIIIDKSTVAVDKEYNAYKIFDVTYNETNYAYTLPKGSAWKNVVEQYFDLNEHGSVYTVTPKTASNYSAVAFAAALNNMSNKPPATVGPKKGVKGQDVVFENLALGYYFVTSGLGSVCNLTTTDPQATIYDKNDKPVIEKTADTTTADVGQTIHYTINGKVPSLTGYESYTYKVTDTMSDGLTFNKDVAVKFGTTTYTPNAKELVYNERGFVLDFNLKAEQFKNLAAVGTAITITYSAVVNEKAIVTGNTKNDAKLEYSNDPGTSGTGETPSIHEVKVYNIKIDKVDSNSKKLPEAKFVLKNSNGKYYKVDDKQVVTWVDKADATVKITDSKGAAEFDGIAAGDYYLEETKAPDGYNILKESIPVNIAADGKVTIDGVALTTIIENGNIPVTVTNYTGSELPETGGIGTTIFYLIGAILVIGAGVVFVTRRRMHSDK